MFHQKTFSVYLSGTNHRRRRPKATKSRNHETKTRATRLLQEANNKKREIPGYGSVPASLHFYQPEWLRHMPWCGWGWANAITRNRNNLAVAAQAVWYARPSLQRSCLWRHKRKAMLILETRTFFISPFIIVYQIIVYQIVASSTISNCYTAKEPFVFFDSSES